MKIVTKEIRLMTGTDSMSFEAMLETMKTIKASVPKKYRDSLYFELRTEEYSYSKDTYEVLVVSYRVPEEG